MHPRGFIRSVRSRGTVSLVALCFVAVLGISLASYIAVCSRAMQLSNRSFQASVSQQLAEAGIEEALRAFNQNNWDDWTSGGISVDWTLDTTNKRATATMTFPSGKFGQGTSASVKLRVDNYDANVLGVSWSSSKNYAPGDLVERSGIWYRCLQTHSNVTPNGDISQYWVPEFVPSSWDSNTSYTPQDMVFHSGYWYRCSSSNTNSPPPSVNWVRVNVVNKDSTSGVTGVQDAVVNWFGTWYRWNSGGWDSSPPISWRWRSTGLAYSYNDLVNYNNTWYRYTSSTPTNAGSSYSNPGADTSRWTLQSTMWLWSSGGIKYNLKDAVYYSGQWYRCIRAHTSTTSLTPTNTTYWISTALYSSDWDSAKRYNQYDTVRCNGVWYLSLQNSNTAQNPSTDSDNSHWIGANTSNPSYLWSASTGYSVGNYRCYGGVWYKCLAATTANAGHSPNNTTYWTPAWSNSWGVTTGAPVVYTEATINLAGSPSQRTQLRALIASAPLFPNAAGTSGDLTITTGTGSADSYDSQVAAYDSSTAGYSAVLAAGGTLAINGTTAVKGYLAWSFGSSPSGISTSTTVKSASSPASPNVDKSRLSRSAYVPQFDTIPAGDLTSAWSTIPLGLALASPSGVGNTLALGTPGATTPARYFVNGALQLGSSEILGTLQINGPVILYINGNLRFRGGSTIYINSTGSLEIHVAGQLITENTTNGFVNRARSSSNPDPSKLILICHSTSTSSLNYSYASNYYGTIYAPASTSSTGLIIGSGVNLYGALAASEITFSSEANLHYDTSLRHATIPGVDQPWTVTQWRELPVTERATMP